MLINFTVFGVHKLSCASSIIVWIRRSYEEMNE